MIDVQKQRVTDWLKEFPGDTVCVRQIWYECFEGSGIPNSETYGEIESVLAGSGDWTQAGDIRYEKMGMQPSFRRAQNPEPVKDGRIMVQHMFKVGGTYRDSEGKLLRIVLSEVFNIRCFELQDGSLVGRMIRFDPCSDYAKTLVEVV